MNWLDAALGGILALSVFFGFHKGFTRTVLQFIAVILGLLLAAWLHGSVGSIFLDYVSHPSVANALGFVLVYLLVSAAGGLLGLLLVKFYKAIGLNWADRLLGAGLGFVRGFVVCAILVLALMGFSRQPPSSAIAGSRLAPYVVDTANILAWIAPRELRDNVGKSHAKIKELWDKAVEQGKKSLPVQAL
jgi:membrane protein required for colicin V production